jgi:hypothetical protein
MKETVGSKKVVQPHSDDKTLKNVDFGILARKVDQDVLRDEFVL